MSLRSMGEDRPSKLAFPVEVRPEDLTTVLCELGAWEAEMAFSEEIRRYEQRQRASLKRRDVLKISQQSIVVMRKLKQENPLRYGHLPEGLYGRACRVVADNLATKTGYIIHMTATGAALAFRSFNEMAEFIGERFFGEPFVSQNFDDIALKMERHGFPVLLYTPQNFPYKAGTVMPHTALALTAAALGWAKEIKDKTDGEEARSIA